MFRHRFAAHAAVEQLVQAGFSRDDISVLMSEETRVLEFGQSGPQGGVLGALVAAVVKVGELLVPGVLVLGTGPLVGAGPRAIDAAALSEGLRAGGIVVGVLVPEERARLAGDVLRLAGGEAPVAA